jgi:hypothetical protein
LEVADKITDETSISLAHNFFVEPLALVRRYEKAREFAQRLPLEEQLDGRGIILFEYATEKYPTLISSDVEELGAREDEIPEESGGEERYQGRGRGDI